MANVFDQFDAPTLAGEASDVAAAEPPANHSQRTNPRLATMLAELGRVASGNEPLLAAQAFLVLLREVIVYDGERLSSEDLEGIELAARAGTMPLADALRQRLSPDRVAFGLGASLRLLRLAFRSPGECAVEGDIRDHLDASNWLRAEIDAELCRLRVLASGDRLFNAALRCRDLEFAEPDGRPN